MQRFARLSRYAASAALLSASIAVAPVATPPLAAQPAGSTQSAARAMRPGDGVRVRIFLEPDLSGEFVVDERGVVVIPKVGEWRVSQVPADSLRPQLLAAYRKYLVTDAIEITPFRRVAISGAVLKPGLYPIDPSMSVGDALILAGGVAPNGKRNAIDVRVAGADTGVPVPAEQLVWESDAGGVRQLHVPERSWIARNFMSTITVPLSILTAITFIMANTRR